MSHYKDIKSLIVFIPNKLIEELTGTRKIKYKGINLKTDYIMNIIHEVYLKYYFDRRRVERELTFNLWSSILKEKYGEYYNYYINYLIDIGFIIMVCDYVKGEKSRTYKMNREYYINIKQVEIKDKVLIKKHSKEYLKKTYVTLNNSTIPVDIRAKLVDDLYDIKINYDSAMEYIENLHDEKKICKPKYIKNLQAIDAINKSILYFKFDEYGRMHTNFTVLKKKIRRNMLSIDGDDDMCEFDIPNSQPLFLIYLMKKSMTINQLIKPDVTVFIDYVQKGYIYEYIRDKCGFKDREDAKDMMFKVLFGQTYLSIENNKLFYNLFPNVFDFIVKFKQKNGSYQSLSHTLQKLESNFIFNIVIRKIMELYPEIKLFTVHDSISCLSKYKKEVGDIFNYYHRNILEN